MLTFQFGMTKKEICYRHIDLMKRALSLFALSLCIVTATSLSPRLSAAETLPPATNPIEETNTQDALRGLLQLQEQLHATQMALEQIRTESSEAASANATFLANRLQAIENAMISQRGRELNAMQSSNHTMVITSSVLAVIGFAAMLLMVFFQWRTVNRLAEISSGMPRLLALGSGSAAPSLPIGSDHLLGTGSAEQSSLRLLGAIEKLQQRIQDLEHTTVPAPVKTPGTNGHANRANGQDPIESAELPALLAKGQSLLDANHADEALACFENALNLKPQHTEALVKKGTALEKLGRLEAAVEAYDRAIQADPSLTIAYLYKGGLFNRMERFSEALACYEQALRTQEKRAA